MPSDPHGNPRMRRVSPNGRRPVGRRNERHGARPNAHEGAVLCGGRDLVAATRRGWLPTAVLMWRRLNNGRPMGAWDWLAIFVHISCNGFGVGVVPICWIVFRYLEPRDIPLDMPLDDTMTTPNPQRFTTVAGTGELPDVIIPRPPPPPPPHAPRRCSHVCRARRPRRVPRRPDRGGTAGTRRS